MQQRNKMPRSLAAEGESEAKNNNPKIFDGSAERIVEKRNMVLNTH